MRKVRCCLSFEQEAKKTGEVKGRRRREERKINGKNETSEDVNGEEKSNTVSLVASFLNL